jgi:hypothetical protein
MSDSKTYSILAMAGVTPFVACALLPLVGIGSIEPFGALDRLAAVYGLAIVSFLTGIHWATQIYAPEDSPFNLLLASNAVFLFTWFAFVLGSLEVALGAQILAFAVLLAVDRRLYSIALISRHYLGVRAVATSLAALSLLVILIS